MTNQTFSATEYEKKYREGYGVVYPESHIIRVHRQILEWELGIKGGNLLDFGCGNGSHLKYFSDNGFETYGCDTSATAVEQCRRLLPQHPERFQVSEVVPNLERMFPGLSLTVFLSNQVLYYLDDAAIRGIVAQAHKMVRPGGVFVASMMSYGCWYARDVLGSEGDFKKLQITSPRQTETMLVNLKQREEIEPLFLPFRRLHLGSYTWHIREEEGGHDHWLYVGVRD